MWNYLETLACVIRIATFTGDAKPARKHKLYVHDDEPYRAEVEDRVRRYYKRGAVR